MYVAIRLAGRVLRGWHFYARRCTVVIAKARATGAAAGLNMAQPQSDPGLQSSPATTYLAQDKPHILVPATPPVQISALFCPPPPSLVGPLSFLPGQPLPLFSLISAPPLPALSPPLPLPSPLPGLPPPSTATASLSSPAFRLPPFLPRRHSRAPPPAPGGHVHTEPRSDQHSTGPAARHIRRGRIPLQLPAPVSVIGQAGG